MKVVFWFLCVPTVLIAAEVEDVNLPWERMGFQAGGYLNAIDSRVSFGVNNSGVNVDIEEALGLKTKTTVGRFSGFYRSRKNPKHRIDLSWYLLSRSGDTTLGRDVTIGETTFPLGTRVNTSFRMDTIKSSYSYSLVMDDRVDLALSMGLYFFAHQVSYTSIGCF